MTQNVQASTILHREHKLISLWSLLRAGESCTRGNLLNLFNIYQTNATCKFKLLTKCFADTFTSNNHLWALVAYRSLCSSGPVIDQVCPAAVSGADGETKSGYLSSGSGGTGGGLKQLYEPKLMFVYRVTSCGGPLMV